MSNLYTTIFPYILTTTLILGCYLTWRHWPTVLRIVKATLFISAILTIGYFATKEPKVVEVSKIIEVQKPEETLDELLQEVPQAYGVPEIVARNIVNQESNGKIESIRFEPSQMSRAAKITTNPEQQRMYASSHCWLQVMGWHSPTLGIKWMDLYKPRVCVEAGMKILSDCINRSKSKNKYDKYFQALTCYNGSEKYAKEVMAAISREIIERNL